MTDSQTVPPIQKQLLVEAPAERAFRVFVENIGSWWPKQHHIGKSPLKSVHIEPRVKGRWFEVCEDGSECDWGHVLAFDPPRRLVLAWQLNMKFEFDPTLVTEVEVLFTPDGPTRTRVEFEHRNLDRFGAGALPVRKEMDAGWAGILEGYTRTAAG